MTVIRLRSRDGLERIEVADGATVGDLRAKIHQQLHIPREDITLSQDAKLVYMLYSIEREVEPAYKPKPLEQRPFGMHMTVEELVARQTRIEQQETPGCASASFDRFAANAFQSYVNSALAFSIKRGGLLYGRVDEDNNVLVDVVFEPPQQGTATSLHLERGTDEERRADFVASLLGLRKVGWIFTQSVQERDFIMSTEEVCQMAAMQDELGEQAVTAVVSMVPSEDGGSVHFEAFQVSKQCVQLWKDGWFCGEDVHTGVSTLRNPKEPEAKAPVIVAGKDVGEVDNDYFLVPVKILDHDGPLITNFEIENRLLPQGKSELKAHMERFKNKGYRDRLADFHLLLYLAKQPTWELETDIAAIVSCVAENKPIPEGYTFMIDSLAGLA